jgi:hypothetical protein
LRVFRKRQVVVATGLLGMLDDRLLPLCRSGAEHLFWDAVVVGDLAPADLGPHIVATARHHDGEQFSWKLGEARQVVLRCSKFIECVLELDRQQLRHDAADSVERQAATRELDLPGRRDDIGLVAGVQDEGLAIDMHNRLEQ